MIKYYVFTGPECSGKSTLANITSQNFDLPLVEEYARYFLSQLQQPYIEEDLDKIAIGQFSAENKNHSHSKIICDTDLITLFIWKEELYNKSKISWAKSLETYRDTRHYLLCKPDIPWQADPLRENPYDRDRLFEIYKEKLDIFGLKYSVIEGNIEQRVHAINNILDFLKI